MNSTISLTSLNQANGGKTCCICLEKESVDIPTITCDHRHEFCNECIIQWLAMKKFDCPICLKVWQDKECSETSSQNDGYSVALEPISSSLVETNQQPPIAYFGIFDPTISARTSRARIYSALICYLCSFFIVIIVYTILILLSRKFAHKV